MNVRSGLIRRVADGFAWVDVERQSGCGRCAESGGCGRSCESVATTYVIPVDSAVLPGERVDVVVSQRAPLIAALLTYGVALLALFVGVALAMLLTGDSDLSVAGGAVVGLIAAAGWLRGSRSRSALIPSVRILSGRDLSPRS
jgi:sigma-E factor negative regulatory protein RseC